MGVSPMPSVAEPCEQLRVDEVEPAGSISSPRPPRDPFLDVTQWRGERREFSLPIRPHSPCQSILPRITSAR